MTNFSSMAAFLWSVADLLRGDFKQSQYGRVILPFTLLRRLECVLESNKPAVLAELDRIQSLKLPEEEAQTKEYPGPYMHEGTGRGSGVYGVKGKVLFADIKL